VAPLRLGGLRGKKSTPSVWLGGTGEFIAVGKQEQELQEHKNHLLQVLGTQVCKSLGVSVLRRVSINCSYNGYCVISSFSGYGYFVLEVYGPAIRLHCLPYALHFTYTWVRLLAVDLPFLLP
jgi:hypothetical protein